MARELPTWQLAFGAVFVASFLGAVLCRLLGAETLVLPIAVPALTVGAWAALGHLVTLDDDLEGGWSNPEGDRKVAWSSLAELAMKILLLAVLALVVWAG